MKTLLLLSLTFVFGSALYGQNKNYLPFIHFHSEYEKQSWSKDKIDYLELYASVDSSITQNEIDHFKKRLNSFYSLHQFSGKPGKKRISEIEALYIDIHNTFLERYREKVDFSAIVRKKEYNCVTASILYAEILKHYHIPYVILNEPQHVLLVAYPEQEYIVLETTSPNFKSFQISEKARRGAVMSMLKNKMITQREIDTLGINQVYEINYQNRERVVENELIGYEYFNKMVVAFNDEKDYMSAVRYAFRTIYLIPNRKEMNQTFAEIAQYAISQTSGLDSSSLQLRLVTLDNVVYNETTSKNIAKGQVGLWLIQNVREGLKVYGVDFLPESLYWTEDYFDLDDEDLYLVEEEELDEEEEEEEEDSEEWVLESEMEEEWDEDDSEKKAKEFLEKIVRSIPSYEENISIFVKNKDWNQVLKVQLYEMVVDFLMEADHPEALDYLLKLKEIDPKNRVVKNHEAEIFIMDFERRIDENPKEYVAIVEEFRQKAVALALPTSYMKNLEKDVFEQFQTTCNKFYRANKLKDGNQYFDLCIEIYSSLKSKLTKSERESVEYALGYLIMLKSEKYPKAERMKILKEGIQLLPNHKALNATYKNALR